MTARVFEILRSGFGKIHLGPTRGDWIVHAGPDELEKLSVWGAISLDVEKTNKDSATEQRIKSGSHKVKSGQG